MPDYDFDLQRFIDAQEPVIGRVLDELKRGRKQSHWMWFVFPQIAGLGFSAMSQRYAIRSAAEARAYLAHWLLGPRLRACVQLVLAVEGRSAHEIFGGPDDLKLRSSLTLFDAIEPGSVFAQALSRYFDGEPDAETVRILG